MRKLIGVLAFLVFVASCNQKKEEEKSLFNLEDKNQQIFMDFLSGFCGQSFAGKQTFIAEGRESWAEKSMVIAFNTCSESLISIAFALGQNNSRTWMLIQEEGSLRLRHDHRNVDGSPEEVTLYGGYADERGTNSKQFFAADHYTCELLPNACYADWVLELGQNLSTLSYSLLNYGDLLFSAQFDLTKPIPPTL